MGEPFLMWAKEFFDRNGRFIDAPIIRQDAYEDYCNSIERREEKKGKNGWIQALKCYVQYCDDLDTLNPDGHPFKQKDGRLMCNTTWRNVTKTWEIIYIKSGKSDKFTTDIQRR